jgi:hypothetical protein
LVPGEVTRVHYERGRVFRPFAAYGFERCFPPKRLEVPCKIVRGYKCRDMRLQAIETWTVKALIVASLIVCIRPGPQGA